MNGAVGRALSSTKFLVFALFMICTTIMVLLGKMEIARWLAVVEKLVPTWLGVQAAVDVAKNVKAGMEAKAAAAPAPPPEITKVTKLPTP